MAKVLVPLSGRAVLDLSLVPGRSLLRPDEFVFESATLVDAVNEWRRWSVHLRAITRAAYERRIVPLLLSADRQVQVRWGVDVGTSIIWGSIESCRIVLAAPQLQSLAFELELAGSLYELHLNDRVVALSGKISDLVEEIARVYNLEPMVEPTQGSPVALIQSYESDWDFLHDRLLPAAINEAGCGGYYLYAEGGRLHFHTRDWFQEPWLLPYNSVEIMAVDDVQEHARDGGAATQLVSYDPLTGLALVKNNDPSRYVRFGQRSSQAGGKTMLAAHTGPNQDSFEQGRAQARYSVNRDRYERISFAGVNLMDLRAGRIVLIRMSDVADSANGYYHVDRVHLTISGGTASAAATAVRGEVAGTNPEGGVKAAGEASTTTAPSEATGREPNFSPATQPVLGEGQPVKIKPAGEVDTEAAAVANVARWQAETKP